MKEYRFNSKIIKTLDIFLKRSMMRLITFAKEYAKWGSLFIGGGAFALALITKDNDLMSFSVVFVLFSIWLFKL